MSSFSCSSPSFSGSHIQNLLYHELRGKWTVRQIGSRANAPRQISNKENESPANGPQSKCPPQISHRHMHITHAYQKKSIIIQETICCIINDEWRPSFRNPGRTVRFPKTTRITAAGLFSGNLFIKFFQGNMERKNSRAAGRLEEIWKKKMPAPAESVSVSHR